MNYTSNNRGRIQLRDRARQIVDFSGLRYGKITPTDLDGLIEYQSKAFVFYEYKYRDAKIPDGQRKALTRLVDCLQKAGSPSVLFVCRHAVDDCAEDIQAARVIVDSLYYDGKWRKSKKNRTAKEYTDKFLKWANGPFDENEIPPNRKG